MLSVIRKVRVDDSYQDLVFRSPADAVKFRDFVAQYQRSGPGNGYGAYWIFDPINLVTMGIQVTREELPQLLPEEKVSPFKFDLELGRISNMTRSILRSRGVDLNKTYVPAIVGLDAGAITFDWPLLYHQ
jgi:hypothetical protein